MRGARSRRAAPGGRREAEHIQPPAQSDAEARQDAWRRRAAARARREGVLRRRAATACRGRVARRPLGAWGSEVRPTTRQAITRAERCAPSEVIALDTPLALEEGRLSGRSAGWSASGSPPALRFPGQGVLQKARQREAPRGPWSRLDIAHELNGRWRCLCCARTPTTVRSEQARSSRSRRQPGQVRC